MGPFRGAALAAALYASVSPNAVLAAGPTTPIHHVIVIVGENHTFDTDGSRIVTASSDKTGQIWDAATGKEILALRGHENVVSSAAFSPDGSRIVTASHDETVRIWNAATGSEIATLRGHEGAVSSAAFSPDGLRIITSTGAFSPDGSRIVTASWDTAQILDVATGKEILALRGHENVV
jgi:WD40 repeat protein